MLTSDQHLTKGDVADIIRYLHTLSEAVMFRNSFRVVFILVLVTGAVLTEGQTFTAAQARHYDKLTHELISPCCFAVSRVNCANTHGGR